VNAAPAPEAVPPAARFDTLVTRALAEDPHRYTRDRLIAEVDAGRHDGLLLRAAEGLSGLPKAEERRAAITTIDYAFERLVLPNLSLEQAQGYCAALEKTVRMSEASGLDRPGPIWLDTVHHTVLVSALFQFAANLRQVRPCDRVVLLHDDSQPDPRFEIVSALMAHLLGIALVRQPLRGPWFRDLATTSTPHTLIVSLADMPPARARRRPMRCELHAAGGIRLTVAVENGSAAFARRLGANHLVLDYPDADRIRLAPFQTERPPACPLVDWVFWPRLVEMPAVA